MKSIAALMILACVTALAGIVAIGVALAMAATGGTTMLWVAGAVCLVIATACTIGVRARNRRNNTGYTLFTI